MPITTSYNRGAVVLLPFPFSDQSAVKLRPAIVLHPPYPSDDLVVVAVTSIGDALRPGEFAIQFWREAGLLHPSFGKRALASISGSLVRKSLGYMHDSDLAQLDQALRLWLGSFKSSVFHSHPKILAGAVVFKGTRVAVQSLFDHLKAGDTIDVFLDRYPSVKRSQVLAVLEEMEAEVLAHA